MEAIRLNTIIKKDGEITMTNLPYKKGQQVEMILLAQPKRQAKRRSLTAQHLRRSNLIGIWAERTDITDSVEFARTLRNRAQRRS